MNLNLCLAIKHHPLVDELREGRPKAAVVSENIIALHERHVTYLEIEHRWAFLPPAYIPGRKKDLFSLEPAQVDNRSKNVRVDWCKEMLEKYDRDE